MACVISVSKSDSLTNLATKFLVSLRMFMSKADTVNTLSVSSRLEYSFSAAGFDSAARQTMCLRSSGSFS